MMLNLLATFVLLVVFGPPLLLAVGILGLCAVASFITDGPRRVRKRFRCPIKQRDVTAELTVPAGADRPSAVLSCSAFRTPTRVVCAQRCLENTRVRWTPPVSVFARWGPIADGIAGTDGTSGPSRALKS